MHIEIEPLTHPDREGRPYERTQEVQAQILEELETDHSTLLDRASISDFKNPSYVHPECLVYLIRRFQREGKEHLAGELMNRLAVRITGPTFRRVSKYLRQVYLDECIDSVIHDITCRLFDLKTDRDDFAQRYFWPWLEARTSNVLRTFLKRQAEGQVIDSLEDAKRDQYTDKKKEKVELKDGKPGPESQALATEAYKLLDKLEPEECLLYVLRYYKEWEIENGDPSVKTISDYFNVTPRTIRNRLHRIEAKLQGWLGGK
jgi:RNA polymerase sigma factor (sigma-70 family)